MRYKCDICNWVYDEEIETIPFNELPEDYTCPVCGAAKEYFSEE